MRETVNDCLRASIAYGVRMLGLLMTIVQRIRIARFYRHQQRLRLKYAITNETPVLSYDSEITALIQAAAAKARQPGRFALTSGSTGEPKRIFFTKQRLRSLKFTFIEFFARCCWTFSLRRTSLYVFSSLTEDQSLTSMLLDEKRLPSYFSTLQAPYRVQGVRSLRLLASTYGTTAVRLWIITISNPGVLYSTNPSTISTFLDDLATNWVSSSRLVRDWHNTPHIFDDSIHRLARRLSARGMAERIRMIAQSDTPLSLKACAPAVASYICWTGGYVQPFLKRIAKHLPPDRYRLISMYSMSTETLETIAHFENQSLTFIPLAPKVLYEFIAEDAQDFASNILQPHQLSTGHTYSLVVSDRYGLRRYQSDDLFLCEGKVCGLPSLQFLRRKGLAYSFTGEKLTEQQLSSVFQTLRENIPELADDFLSCVPSHPPDDTVPHYKLVIVREGFDELVDRFEQISRDCDQLLTEINHEYRSKRESGRLGQMRLVQLRRKDFISAINAAATDAWEAQFKFLPLYRQTWESKTSSTTQSCGSLDHE